MPLLPAFIDPGTIAVMIPIIVLMIPIVALLTGHQRRMAEIMYGARQAASPELDARVAYEVESMRRELAEVKALLHQQAIAIDNLAPRLPARERLVDNVTRENVTL